MREGPHLGTSRDGAEDSDIAALDLDPWSFEMLRSEDRKARIKDISQRDKDQGNQRFQGVPTQSRATT
jgi:hypothetical protein